MKKISLILSLIIFSSQLVFSQELEGPAAGKALVIFTRPTIDAPLIKFSYFDK